VQPFALPIEPLAYSALLNQWFWRELIDVVEQILSSPGGLLGIGKPSVLALQILARHEEVHSFYDAMDDFPAFYEGLSRRAMAQHEKLIAQKVTKILASSTALAARFDMHKSKVSLALNACDVESLPPSSYIQSPPASGQVVLGYVGTIGFWFDWELVIALARACPVFCVRLIGPLHTPLPHNLPENIEILPACDHTAAMQAMQRFSVGLIPFKRVGLTVSVDPIKYYEYRALSLPVISTRFGEMALRGYHNGVFLAEISDDLAGLLERVLAYKPEKNEIQQFRHNNSWGARFDTCNFLT
jgi:hypothetical protein